MNRDELVMLIAGNNSYEETNTIMQAIDAYVAAEIERFVEAVEREAEKNMLKTGKLKCYSAMKKLLRERAKGE